MLTAADVNTILTQAAQQTTRTRGAIRQPLGSFAHVSIAVIDLNGDVLGVLPERRRAALRHRRLRPEGAHRALLQQPGRGDGAGPPGLGRYLRDGVPLDGSVAFTSRAVGFLAQPFFPPGIAGHERGRVLAAHRDLERLQHRPPARPHQGAGLLTSNVRARRAAAPQRDHDLPGRRSPLQGWPARPAPSASAATAWTRTTSSRPRRSRGLRAARRAALRPARDPRRAPALRQVAAAPGALRMARACGSPRRSSSCRAWRPSARGRHARPQGRPPHRRAPAGAARRAGPLRDRRRASGSPSPRIRSSRRRWTRSRRRTRRRPRPWPPSRRSSSRTAGTSRSGGWAGATASCSSRRRAAKPSPCARTRSSRRPSSPFPSWAGPAPPIRSGSRPSSSRTAAASRCCGWPAAAGQVVFQTTRGEGFSVPEDQVVSPPIESIPSLDATPGPWPRRRRRRRRDSARRRRHARAARAARALPLPEPDFVPIRSRWDLPFPADPRWPRGRLVDPYNQNILKGDKPIAGNSVFLVLTGALESPFEGRRLPVGSGVSAERAGSQEFFGAGRPVLHEPAGAPCPRRSSRARPRSSPRPSPSRPPASST